MIERAWQRVVAYGWLLLPAATLASVVVAVRETGRWGERQEKAEIAQIAAAAAAALSPEVISMLRGNPLDAGTPAFRNLHQSLSRVRAVNPEARFVYLMRRHKGQFVFLADAEPETSADYSPPGQVYDDQVAGLLQVLESGKPVVEDPYRDDWGEWVSALAPVMDRPGATPVAIFGMDINAQGWRANVARYRAFAATVGALFMGLLTLFLLSARRQRRFNATQAQLNQQLQHELAERRVLESRLSQMAAVDGLTGIANRRSFDEALRREWGRAQRERLPLSLIMADLDYFKRYNDRYGHLDGDDCLRQVAAALAGCGNRPADLVARYGGEEFGIVLPDTDAAAAHLIAQRVNDAVRNLGLPHEDSDVAKVMTICAGHATLVPSADLEPRELIQRADTALYEAKRAGRDTVRPLSPG